jgi:hypothetical protein
MSTSVCGPDGIPILKRLTAMEPELLLPPEKAEDESPTLELSEDEGYDADEDAVVEEEEDAVVEEDAEECQKEDNGSLQNLMPLFPVLAIVCLAYLWGVAYALSSTRSVYPPAF